MQFDQPKVNTENTELKDQVGSNRNAFYTCYKDNIIDQIQTSDFLEKS